MRFNPHTAKLDWVVRALSPDSIGLPVTTDDFVIFSDNGALSTDSELNWTTSSRLLSTKDLDVNGVVVDSLKTDNGSILATNVASGIVTLGGTGGANNEDLAFDFENAANTVELFSNTGADTIDWIENTFQAGKLGVEVIGLGSNFTYFIAQAQAAEITYTLPAAVGNAGEVLTDAAGDGTLSWAVGGVAGPGGGSTDHAIVRWDGVGGDTLQDSGITLDDNDDFNISNGDKIQGGYLRIGNAGTVNFADEDGDLYVEDELEVDGVIRAGSDLFMATDRLIFMGDDSRILMGNASDAQVSWAKAGNDHMYIRVNSGSSSQSGNLIIGEDSAKDWGHPVETDPHLRIQSGNATDISDFIQFWHDDTDGNIEVGAGDLKITAAGGDVDFGDENITLTGNITFGDDNWIGLGAASARITFDDTGGKSIDIAGSSALSITDGDINILTDSKKLNLGVSNDAYIEFDGDSLNIVANAVTAGNTMEFTAGSYEWKVPANTDIAMVFTGTDNTGVLTWMEDENYFKSSQKWLFLDKISFTQADENEFIDSLNTGYLDYSVTTAHRFNTTAADTDIRMEFVETTSSGLFTWMEDEDLFKFDDDAQWLDNEKVVFGSALTGDAQVYFDTNDLFIDMTNAAAPADLTFKMYDSNGTSQVVFDDSDGQPMVIVDSDGQVSFEANSSKVTGLKINTIAQTSNYYALTKDDMVLGDSSGGAFTVFLNPASTNTGKVYHIKKTDSSVNVISADANAAETIDGDVVQVLSIQYQSYSLISDGTEWHLF